MTDRVPECNEIERFLIDELALNLGLDARGIDPREPFARYGIDSLAAVRLATQLEEKFGCELPSTTLWDYPSIESLAGFLAGELSSNRAQDRRSARGNGA